LGGHVISYDGVKRCIQNFAGKTEDITWMKEARMEEQQFNESYNSTMNIAE